LAGIPGRASRPHPGPLHAGEIVELWPNPANYQSGGAAHTLAFTAAPTATSVQFQYQVSTASIRRKTHFLGGVSAGSTTAVAARISYNPDKNTNASPEPGRRGLFYIYTDPSCLNGWIYLILPGFFVWYNAL